MRRPKHRKWRAAGSDCHRHQYTSHGDKNVVTITVTEHETTGKLIIELHDIQGEVTLLGPDAGLVLELSPRENAHKACACHKGQHCTISHDPSKCTCQQCTTAEAALA